MVTFTADEPPHSVQLYGVDPASSAWRSHWSSTYGVDHVDLNFGCPVAEGDPQGRRGGAARPAAAVRPHRRARGHGRRDRAGHGEDADRASTTIT